MSVSRPSVIPKNPPARGHETCAVHRLESAAATELYLTATPGPGPAQRQAQALYEAIARVLRQEQAVIVAERLFADRQALEVALAARARAYGELDDGVAPSLLTPRAPEQPILGVQVHAIRGITQPTILSSRGVPRARAFTCAGYSYLTASALGAENLKGGPAQTHAVFSQAHDLLRQAGGSIRDIARTWVWTDDILAWYPQFNQARSAFFGAHGLFAPPGFVPASTGIGVSPAGGARLALDLFAAWGKPDAVARFPAAGNQNPANLYGSAFARAARAKTPAGSTIFCSGTAAIDAQGRTCARDDAGAQVQMTLDNVHAVLRDMGCTSADVVQAMAYCATPQALDGFRARAADALPWPCLTMTGDICRGDLLFEVEVTARQRAD